MVQPAVACCAARLTAPTRHCSAPHPAQAKRQQPQDDGVIDLAADSDEEGGNSPVSWGQVGRRRSGRVRPLMLSMPRFIMTLSLCSVYAAAAGQGG